MTVTSIAASPASRGGFHPTTFVVALRLEESTSSAPSGRRSRP